MTRALGNKKFEADIPQELWDRYEKWAEDHGRISNRQLAEGLFRLFLSVPEWLRLMSLYGFEGEDIIHQTFEGVHLTVTVSPEVEGKRLARSAAEAALSHRPTPASTKTGT